MNTEEYLLVCLAEESGEVARASHKALRFGLDDGFPGTSRTNRQDIVQEANDLLGVIEVLIDNGIELPGLFDRVAIETKKAKVYRFMDYSVARGRLRTDL